ncbi:uncharacterized protein LOC134837994 isoform X3 [Culicoides brevitarsis]|uniref:uncharacterized protein LOC134837994 isoform X3 n=1 Tax=Culicoides brevitarsis TaxID=469753 RepID=UPI00307BFF7C
MESGDTATLPLSSRNSGERTSLIMPQRPCSLFNAEKESLSFPINLVGAPPEVEQLIEHIKSVAEQFLYHWKTFPINLPAPLTPTPATGTVSRKPRPINLRDLFIAPPFDELDAVATDGTGEPRRLTNSQLRAVREKGEFDVPSLNFPGQVHRWRLSQILQKGTERTHDSLLSDLALAARFLVVTACARLYGSFFSVAQAAKALLKGFMKLLDITVGVPSLVAHNLEQKVKEERCRYLIAELVCRTEYEDCLDSLCTYVRRQLRRATMEKFDVECDTTAQPVPYLFVTPKGQDIDLRLFSRDIMRKALPILVQILEKETRGWFLHFRERLIAELREKKMSDAEIEEEVNEAVMKEYLQRVYTSILNNPDLAELGSGVPQLLVQQAQSVVIMHKAIEKVKKDLEKARNEQEKLLIKTHPVLSRIAPWMRMKLRIAESSRMSKTIFAAHEEALKICLKHNLQQTVYFLNRDLAFLRDREPILLKELKNDKTPTRNFQWAIRIWSPKSWIIRRSFQGHSEVIPTVTCQQATSIVTPRSDPSQPVFLVEKDIIRTTTTRWPLWRVMNLVQRTWTWTWNTIFLLGVIVPWCSPLGLRALFCVKPFMPDLELSQVNGTLFPRKTSITPTMVSRLVELWRHISKARTKFETEPDTGFIGKGITRQLNRLYNYVIKGFLGTFMILFLFPLLCIVVSGTSIFFALTAPLWIPFVTIILHIYIMLIYDIDCPDDNRNRFAIVFEAIGWNILAQGVLQPIAALFVGGIICPFLSVCVLIVGFIRYWFRIFWDSVMFHLFIKKVGRIPASDGFAVRRIAGPGLFQDYYFAIKPEQALAAFEAKMELDELQAYQHSMETIICQPQKDFSQFVEACFGPFSATLAKSGPYKNLEREAQDLMVSLHEKLEKRRRELQTGLTSQVKSRIKLNTVELKIAIQQGAHMLERFYPNHVISRLSMGEDEFWDAKGLSVGDWAGLAGLIYADIFGLDFLTPLSDTDTQFKLEPHTQLDLVRYSEMVQSASEIINGPDLLGNVYTPRGNIQVHSPYLEVTAFNPRSRLAINTNKTEKKDTTAGLTTPRVRARRTTLPQTLKRVTLRPWKRKQYENIFMEKLLIPLPIPHPVHIAISIYNRDSDSPIPLECDVCGDILKSIEDCQGDMLAVNAVSRFRGGGGATESSIDSLDSRSQTSGDTRDSMDIVGSTDIGCTDTLPCVNRTETVTITSPQTADRQSIGSQGGATPTGSTNQRSYQWTLSSWAGNRRNRNGQNNTETVRVDLASPEDISLDTDSTRVVFSFLVIFVHFYCNF